MLEMPILAWVVAALLVLSLLIVIALVMVRRSSRDPTFTERELAWLAARAKRITPEEYKALAGRAANLDAGKPPNAANPRYSGEILIYLAAFRRRTQDEMALATRPEGRLFTFQAALIDLLTTVCGLHRPEGGNRARLAAILAEEILAMFCEMQPPVEINASIDVLQQLLEEELLDETIARLSRYLLNRLRTLLAVR